MTANEGERAWTSAGGRDAPGPEEPYPGGYGPGGYESDPYGPGGYGPYGPPYQYGQYGQYGPYGPWYGGPPPRWRPPYSGEAIAALVLAIVSFIVFPVIPAIIALVLAHVARRKIWASGGAFRGFGLSRIATILASINLIFAAFGIAIAAAINA